MPLFGPSFIAQGLSTSEPRFWDATRFGTALLLIDKAGHRRSGAALGNLRLSRLEVAADFFRRKWAVVEGEFINPPAEKPEIVGLRVETLWEKSA